MTDAGIGGPTIGLLAGMGVKSTAPFLEMVIDECRRQYGAEHQSDYPQMIIFSWPTSVRFDRPLDHERISARIAEGVRWLSTTGVDFIALPANLPHLYFDRLEAAATVPMLNIIEIAAARIPRDAGTVALMATRPTRDHGLYHRPLETRGIHVVATDEMQAEIDAILAALWRGDDASAIRARWLKVVSGAIAAGASSALLACTDLNAIDRWAEIDLPIHDATRALASAVVSKWCDLAGVTRTSEPAW
jgi:aspartate racemase